MRTNEYDQPVGDPLPGWTPRPALAPAHLMGRWCELRSLATLDEAGREELWAAVAGPPQLWTYLAAGPFADRAGFDAYLAGVAAIGHTLVVHAPGPVGVLSYLNTQPAHGSSEVGSVTFGPALQRTTAATEAVHLVMRHAFELGYRRFEWKCDSLNEPSRRAAVRLGFVPEGRFRNAVVYKGRTRDTDWFSVTDAEWPAVRAGHERWLDPANFDDEGRQRSPLRASVEA
jgi:RimJ/RimL family protein N-acetyltransferase